MESVTTAPTLRSDVVRGPGRRRRLAGGRQAGQPGRGSTRRPRVWGLLRSSVKQQR